MVSKQLAALTKRGAVFDTDFTPFPVTKEKKKKDVKQPKPPKKASKPKIPSGTQPPPAKKPAMAAR